MGEGDERSKAALLAATDTRLVSLAVCEQIELSANLGGPAMSESYLKRGSACYACPRPRQLPSARWFP